MGTGIVSVGLSLDGRETLSRILLVITAIAWVILAVLLGARVSRDLIRVHQEARSPAGLTGVAGTEVLGTRMTLLGWTWVGIALLIIGLVLWLLLLWPVLANWVVPTFGGSFVLAVATESLAVLSATVAAAQHARWVAVAALVPFVLGLAFYLFVIRRFDFRQLLVGHGDHWITGGALAIATLAIARITLAADSLHTLTGAIGTLEELTIGAVGAVDRLDSRAHDRRGGAAEAGLRRAAMGDRVPDRDIRGLQRSRRLGRPRIRDDGLRPRLGLDRARRVAGRVRGDAAPRR